MERGWNSTLSFGVCANCSFSAKMMFAVRYIFKIAIFQWNVRGVVGYGWLNKIYIYVYICIHVLINSFSTLCERCTQLTDVIVSVFGHFLSIPKPDASGLGLELGCNSWLQIQSQLGGGGSGVVADGKVPPRERGHGKSTTINRFRTASTTTTRSFLRFGRRHFRPKYLNPPDQWAVAAVAATTTTAAAENKFMVEAQ